MKTLLVALLMLLGCSAPLVAQNVGPGVPTQTFSTMLQRLPFASVPLAGNETVVVLQGGTAKQTTLAPLQLNFSTPLALPTQDGQNTLFQNGTKTAFGIYGPAAPANLFDFDNIRSVIDLEPGVTVQNYNAFGGWIWNNIPSVLSGGITYRVGVGLETYCANIVVGATCFGLNPAFTDSFDGTTTHAVTSTMGAGEADFTAANAGSSVTGWSFVLQGPVQPAGATVVDVLVNTTTIAKWKNGFVLEDGSLTIGGAGLNLGTNNAASGASLSSDTILFNITDTGSTEHHISLGGSPNSTASQLVISDALAANGLAFITASGVNPAQVNAAGSGTNINLLLSSKGTTGYVGIFAGGSNMFDCNRVNSGYCTITSTNGLALNALNIVQGAAIISNNGSGYQLLSNGASAVTPTMAPNLADLKAGIGADAAGDVSIIGDNAGTPTEQIRATGVGSMLRGGGSAMFDCNITATGYCSVTSTNGLNANTLNVINVGTLNANTAGSYELLGAAASATGPTLIPNKGDLKAGIGADVAGDVSIIADNAGTATEIIRISSTLAALNTQIQFASSTTGASTQTFTNSPCAGLTTERWIPIKIGGQTGVWNIPACQ